jgi:hypothetical protein
MDLQFVEKYNTIIDTLKKINLHEIDVDESSDEYIDEIKYYKIYIHKRDNFDGIITLTTFYNNRSIEYTVVDILDFMSDESIIQLSTYFSASYGEESKNIYGMYYIIRDLLKKFGPMRLLYGNIISYAVHGKGNYIYLMFSNEVPYELSEDVTLRKVYIPCQYIASRNNINVKYGGYYVVYFK